MSRSGQKHNAQSWESLPNQPSGTPINKQQINTLVANSDNQDMIFYEYEIVNKKKERQWGMKQARKYGLCLCSRWLFLLIGNAILVTLICGVCAILLYVNEPVDVTIKPLDYNVFCSTGTNNCDTIRNLVCTSNVCSCYSNYVWNGTDCACTANMYWDGLACISYQGYQQTCSPNLPCSTTPNLLTCDDKSGTCLCASTSTFYYTHFYTGAVTDYYGNLGGTCQIKTTAGVDCTAYGVKSCMEWLNLTCSHGPINNYLNCYCYNGYYWNTITGACVIQGTTVGTTCVGTYSNYGCNYNSSLVCSASTCQCATNFFYHTGVSACTVKRGYQGWCQDTTWCNTTALVQCFLSITSTTVPACNCPQTSLLNTCDCPKGFWWDGQICVATKGLNSPCPGQYACTSPFICIYGYCLA